MSAQGTLDKGIAGPLCLRVAFDDDVQTAIDAALGGLAKNAYAVRRVSYPGGVVEQFSMFDFVGFVTPDSTDYPDTIAPIGSTYLYLTASAGAVTNAQLFLKTAASTWTAYGSV